METCCPDCGSIYDLWVLLVILPLHGAWAITTFGEVTYQQRQAFLTHKLTHRVLVREQ